MTEQEILKAMEITKVSFDSEDIFYIQKCLKNIKTNINLIEEIIEKTIENKNNYSIKNTNQK